MTIEKSIGWTDITKNPIKGICKGGCWYCFYSGNRGIAKRFKHNPEIILRLDVLDFLPKNPKKIFLCSTHDLFGDWISKTWRDLIFANLSYYPQHTFQILTKFPQNIDREMPDNVWLGVTVTEEKAEEVYRIYDLKKAKARIKFISFEPLFSDIHYDLSNSEIDWIIVGRLTGYGNRFDPKREWIERLVHNAEIDYQQIFLKNNLKDIWKEPLIQEFPK